MLVTQGYRFALDPTPRQQRALASHCGAARYAHNWALNLVKQRLDQRGAGQDVEVPWTLPALRREWNRAKHEVAPWWRENSKEAYKSGLDALARGLKNWSDSKSGRRAGRRMGFPRRKPRHRTRPACRFTTGAIRVEPDRHHVVLPRIGRIRTHESTRKLARRLEAGTARILSATVSCTADRWFVSFTVGVQRRIPAPRPGGDVVGVDVGVRHLAVLSTGQVVANPRPLDLAQRRLRRLNRQLARRRGPRAPDGTRRTPSAGWRQTKQRLGRAHARVAHLRRDGLHKLTTDLAATFDTVVVEEPQRRRHGAQPAPRPPPRRRGVRRAASAARLQDHLARVSALRGRPVVPVVEDLLGLRGGESQAAPVRPGLPLRRLRDSYGP